MNRKQFVGIFDLALSMASGLVISTETPVDDTLLRYATFARNDPSFNAIMDRLFGPEVAAMVDADGREMTIEETALAMAEPTILTFAKKESITAAEAANYAAIFIGVLQAIRKSRQARKAAETPAE